MKEVRVPKARFKYNMNPFVREARAGKTVIVTNDGKDEFKVVPCMPTTAPPVLSGLVNPKDYAKIDLDEPAFKSWQRK
jgi:hypothetical protein